MTLFFFSTDVILCVGFFFASSLVPGYSRQLPLPGSGGISTLTRAASSEQQHELQRFREPRSIIDWPGFTVPP